VNQNEKLECSGFAGSWSLLSANSTRITLRAGVDVCGTQCRCQHFILKTSWGSKKNLRVRRYCQDDLRIKNDRVPDLKKVARATTSCSLIGRTVYNTMSINPKSGKITPKFSFDSPEFLSSLWPDYPVSACSRENYSSFQTIEQLVKSLRPSFHWRPGRSDLSTFLGFITMSLYCFERPKVLRVNNPELCPPKNFSVVWKREPRSSRFTWPKIKS
jgi:hypothetical protein